VARKVVKIGAAPRVKSVGQVFKEFGPRRAKVRFEINHGLGTVLNVFAHGTTQISGYFGHGLRCRACDVVKFVRVPVWPLS
jgi:hypothetical protein